MDLSLGAPEISQVTSVTTTTTAGNDIQWTKTAGGTALKWISEPLSSSTTISGTITFNIYAKESATSVNSTIRPTVILYHGGAETTTISNCGFATELTASIAAKNWTTASGGWTACSVTSTAIAAGDRIVVKAFANGCTTTCTVAGGSMAAGTVTVDYDGPTDAADGSSWVQLNETETFSADGGAGGTPSIVQWVGTPNLGNSGQSNAAGGSIKVALPATTQAGNMIWIGFGISAGTVWSVTDDGGNTYSKGPTGSGNGYTFNSFYALNAAAARVLTVTHTTGTVVFFSAITAEVKNIATSSAFDAGSCNLDQSGTTVTAGSLTPLSSGDFLIQMVFDETFPTTTAYTVGSQSNITWGFLSASLSISQAAQYGTYASTSAINPTFTRHETSLSWLSCASAFKSSLAGGDATGMRIKGIQTETYTPTTTSPQLLQFPTVGNLAIDAYQAGGGDIISSMTSASPSLTWTNTGSAVTLGNASSIMFCAANTSPSLNMTISASMNQTAASDDSHMMIDVVGANSTACASATGSLNHTGTGTKTGITPLDTITFTPSLANSLIVSTTAIDFNTIVGTTNTGCLLQNGFLSTNSAGNTQYYENNGWLTCLNHAASSIAEEWTVQSGLGTNDSEWSARAVEFLAPAAGCAACELLLGVGH